MSRTSSPANKSLRGGSRGPETGVRGIPSPFINLDERGRDTPHPSLLPLLPPRKDFLDEVLGTTACRRRNHHRRYHRTAQSRTVALLRTFVQVGVPQAWAPQVVVVVPPRVVEASRQVRAPIPVLTLVPAPARWDH